MPEDFSDLPMPLLFLWGDQDGLLGPERYAIARSRLPEATDYVTVNGANHRDFAMYSHQFFDGAGDNDLFYSLIKERLEGDIAAVGSRCFDDDVAAGPIDSFDAVLYGDGYF